jgi:hypothetical protein
VRRLLTIEKSVERLEAVGPLDPARLENDATIGLVVERLLALVVDLASAINRDVAFAQLGEEPASPEASFAAAARAGLINADLAADLAVPDGAHVLLQLCLDLEPERVAGVVSAATIGYREYVTQVSRWANDRGEPSTR